MNVILELLILRIHFSVPIWDEWNDRLCTWPVNICSRKDAAILWFQIPRCAQLRIQCVFKTRTISSVTILLTWTITVAIFISLSLPLSLSLKRFSARTTWCSLFLIFCDNFWGHKCSHVVVKFNREKSWDELLPQCANFVLKLHEKLA